MIVSEQAGATAPDSRSIEQRIGSLLGDAPAQPPPKQQQAPQQQEASGTDEQTDQPPNPEDATSGSDPEQTAPEFAEVEYEGETYQVPPKLKDAIIRQSDYTKKTQAVADRERLISHREQQLRSAQMNQEFQSVIQPQLHELAQIESQLSQYDKVNWREIPADERTAHMLEMHRLERAHDAKKQEIEGKRTEHQTKLNEHLSNLQADANKLLTSRIPGWSEKTAKEVRDWAVGNGFTQEEISSIYDPRHAEVLWKASQYDKARAGAKPAVQQAKAAKPTSANPMPQSVKEKLNFKKQVAATAPGSHERNKAVESRISSLFSKSG